jgi:gluconolactonase
MNKRQKYKRAMKALLPISLFYIGTAASAQQAFFDRDSITGADPTAHTGQIIQAGPDSGGAAPGLRLISARFSFTEGPAVDRQGNVFFTDQPNNQIWEYHTDGRLTLFMDSAGRSNGMYFDKKGNLVSCADEHDQLWSIRPDGKVTVLVSGWQGHRLNGPNDLWIDPKGGVYFTDPYYQRDYWDRTAPDIKGQKVYYLPKRKKEPIVADSNLVTPNGIVGTPDGKRLYVSDLAADKTYIYRIRGDGSLTDRQLFVALGSDGMTLDSKGNVYLCGKGITVYDPSGKKIAYIPVPGGWTGNLCFGGRDKRTLFITASRSVFTLPMRVAGVE